MSAYLSMHMYVLCTYMGAIGHIHVHITWYGPRYADASVNISDFPYMRGQMLSEVVLLENVPWLVDERKREKSLPIVS